MSNEKENVPSLPPHNLQVPRVKNTVEKQEVNK